MGSGRDRSGLEARHHRKPFRKDEAGQYSGAGQPHEMDGNQKVEQADQGMKAGAKIPALDEQPAKDLRALLMSFIYIYYPNDNVWSAYLGLLAYLKRFPPLRVRSCQGFGKWSYLCLVVNTVHALWQVNKGSRCLVNVAI